MTVSHRSSVWNKSLESSGLLSALLRVWPGLILFATGLIFSLYQCLLWLRDGEWPVLMAEDLLSSFLPATNPLLLWLRNPEEWHQLHLLITDYSVSLVLILIGVAGYLLGFSIYKVAEIVWQPSDPHD